MWVFPALLLLSLIIAIVTAEEAMLGMAGVVLIIWLAVLFGRGVSKQFAPVREADQVDKNPVAAQLLSYDGNSTTKASVLGTATRGAVGSMLAGPAGFVVGVATTKRKTKSTGCSATFLVEYESGRQGVETVDVDSMRFQTLYNLAKKNDT